MNGHAEDMMSLTALSPSRAFFLAGDFCCELNRKQLIRMREAVNLTITQMAQMEIPDGHANHQSRERCGSGQRNTSSTGHP